MSGREVEGGAVCLLALLVEFAGHGTTSTHANKRMMKSADAGEEIDETETVHPFSPPISE
jgi:hypothetical protein